MIVLGTHARSFRRVFDAAQEQLQKVFGMEMAELPVRGKRTLKEKQSKHNFRTSHNPRCLYYDLIIYGKHTDQCFTRV